MENGSPEVMQPQSAPHENFLQKLLRPFKKHPAAVSPISPIAPTAEQPMAPNSPVTPATETPVAPATSAPVKA